MAADAATHHRLAEMQEDASQVAADAGRVFAYSWN